MAGVGSCPRAFGLRVISSFFSGLFSRLGACFSCARQSCEQPQTNQANESPRQRSADANGFFAQTNAFNSDVDSPMTEGAKAYWANSNDMRHAKNKFKSAQRDLRMLKLVKIKQRFCCEDTEATDTRIETVKCEQAKIQARIVFLKGQKSTPLPPFNKKEELGSTKKVQFSHIVEEQSVSEYGSKIRFSTKL